MGGGGRNLTYEVTMSGASLNSVVACWIGLTASERATGTLWCCALLLASSSLVKLGARSRARLPAWCNSFAESVAPNPAAFV